MSKLPKPPFEFNLSRKRNTRPMSSKSTVAATTQLYTKDEEPDPGMDDNDDLKVGDRVLVDGRQLYGTLRFLGPTQFKSGKWAGVELDYQGTGKNDGSVKGIYYFTCAPNTGIFVPSSKVSLVSRCQARHSTKSISSSRPYVNTSSLSLSSPSPSSPSTATSVSFPSPQTTTTLKKPNSNKYSQRTAVHTNVTPSSSLVESKHVDYEHHQQQQLQYHHQQPPPQANHVMEDSDRRHRMLMDRYQQEVGSYQAKLGREQHRVYELRKEREHLLQQLQQSNQQIAHQDQLIQQWQQSQDRVQHLEESNRQQAIVVEQLDGELQQARATHRQESAQLMEQQSHLIQELQRERHDHDAIKSTMRHVEQACQALMDPFDVRPGLGLVDQLKETQRQVKDLLEKVRLDTDQQNQQRRDINALHRDVASLESLIETKLFKEADLLDSVEFEQQRNRQLQDELKLVKKQHLTRRRKGNANMKHHSTIVSSTTNNNNSNKKHVLSLDGGRTGSRWAIRSGETLATSTSSFFGLDDDDDDDDVDVDNLPAYCEICEAVGHDLMSCLHTMNPAEPHKVRYSTHMNPTPVLHQKMLPSL